MSPFRSWLRSVAVCGLAACFTVTTTGCQSLLTARLWNNQRSYSEPGPAPDLHVYKKTDREFFIQYVSIEESSGNSIPRIFLLNVDHPFANPHQPRFVEASRLQG